MDKQEREELRALTEVPRNGSAVAFVAGLQRNELRALLDALDAAEQRAERAEAALQDCRLLAARHRREQWAQDVLRYCAAAGVTGSPLRDGAALGEQTGEGGGNGA